MKEIIAILLLVFCLVAAGCSGPAAPTTPVTPLAKPAPETGFVLNASIRPGDDFYLHVNDAWIREHPIPADKDSYISYIALRDKVDDDLHSLLSRAANTSGTQDRNMTRLGQFYRSGMDSGKIDRDGLAGLSEDLGMIDSIGSRADLTNATVTLLVHGSNPLYSYNAEINPRNSEEMIAGLEQGGLGLPDRDYYLRTDNKSKSLQVSYQGHIARVLQIDGESPELAATHAGTIYAMEKTLAKSHFSNVENRDPVKTTNLYTPTGLVTAYPHTGWDRLLAINGSGTVKTVDVHQPQFLNALDTMIATAPLEDWKVYLRYRVIDDASPYLGPAYENESFAFYKKDLNGIAEMKPRWKRVVNTESASLPDLVGQAYVAEYVDPRTRGMVSDMFREIRQTFDQRIANLTWMSTPTKNAAREKLAAMRQKIAYPDTYTDYSGLVLSDSYAGNVRSASAYGLVHGAYGLEKIGRPVDHDAWTVSPQIVNAFYDPTRNEIIFPAAFLQPPFFDPDQDAAVNYGSLGFVVGHEMTHGFDDWGRQFDKTGTLKNWWTPEDEQNFNNQTAILVTQYNHYEVLPGLFVNGNLTLGENIADFGGATLAYHAWKNTENSSLATTTSGASADRRFFYAAARTWRGSTRDEAIRTLVYTDPHSPEQYRVNGVLFNIPEFYNAFSEIRHGDRLYRNVSERPVIW
ncbi:M13 family metallopeptidase [uncultured Methanoregula sp.]|uniref:M13 family metallopeptidase n=1 Tax=uncultured Methanoregula sp. TaxID=1005933 RepID=UPI002AAC4C9C|nr:M13 family metallopeptidase [uncultured Methanoregula sp.]